MQSKNKVPVFFKISSRYDDLGKMEAKVFIEEISKGEILELPEEAEWLGTYAKIPRESIFKTKRLILTQRILFNPVITKINGNLKEENIRKEIIKNISEKLEEAPDWIEFENFRTKVFRHGHDVPKIITNFFEREIGGEIVQKYSYKVKLKNPDLTYFLEFTKDMVISGWGINVSSISEYMKKGPKHRPYFGVGVLDPVVARVMVNLTGALPGETIYDPFCGMAGVLIEACKMGMNAIGGDISIQKTYGAKINLDAEKCSSFSILRHDALYNPVKHVKRIATDPPYAIGTKVVGKETPEELFENFLEDIKKVLMKGNRIVVALPTRIFRKINLKQLGYEELLSGEQKVHGGLVRTVKVITYARTS